MRRIIILIGSALAALCLVLAGSPAWAAVEESVPPPDASGPTSAATLSGVNRSAGPNRAADVITCTPSVQNPHNSSHVRGTVNVVVTLSCTKPVPRISIRAALYRNGKLVKDSGAKNASGARAQNNAAVPCSNATYQGWMSYYVQFPPGYSPPSGASSGFGRAVTITC